MSTTTRLLRGALLAAVSFPVAAQSNVTLSGVLDMFVANRQLAGQRHIFRADHGGMTTSRWAVEGNEDLGGGLKAQFGMSGFLRVDTGQSGRNDNDVFWHRYAFVGVTGGFGTVRLGRQATPTFVSAIRFSPFAESTPFSPYLLHLYSPAQPLLAPLNPTDSAASNALTYATPVFGGFSVVGLFSLGEQQDTGVHRSSVGVNYLRGPFAFSLTTERTNIPGQFSATASREANVQGGASYDFGVVKLFAQGSRTTLDLVAGGDRRFTTFQGGVSVPVGSGAVLVSYAQTRKTEPALTDIRRRTAVLGYDYYLSKRTDLYAVAFNDRVTNLSNGNTVAAGIRHRF